MKKRILFLLTAAVLFLPALCGCSGAQEAKTDDTQVSQKPAESTEPEETAEPEESAEPAITAKPTAPEPTAPAETNTPLPTQEEPGEPVLLDTISFDIDGDGRQDEINVYENDDVCFITVKDDSKTYVIFDVSGITGYKSVQVLEYSNQKKCLLFSYYDYGTYTSIWFFEGLEPINMFNKDGFFVNYQDDVLTVSRFTDTIGTWYVEYKYMLDEEGLHLLDVPYAMSHVCFDTVTTKIDIEAYYFDGESYTVEGVIEAGEVITFTHILFGVNEEYICFELEDGTKGRFLVEREDEAYYGVTVNGKSVKECFVDIEEYFNDTWL